MQCTSTCLWVGCQIGRTGTQEITHIPGATSISSSCHSIIPDRQLTSHHDLRPDHGNASLRRIGGGVETNMAIRQEDYPTSVTFPLRRRAEAYLGGSWLSWLSIHFRLHSSTRGRPDRRTQEDTGNLYARSQGRRRRPRRPVFPVCSSCTLLTTGASMQCNAVSPHTNPLARALKVVLPSAHRHRQTRHTQLDAIRSKVVNKCESLRVDIVPVRIRTPRLGPRV